MFKRITESTTWKDPVWSKIIANSIWGFMVSIFGVILAWLLGISIDSLYLFIKENWQCSLNIIFLAIILVLLRKNRSLKEKMQPPTVKIGLDWLLLLPDNELYDFKMILVWFPLNDTFRVGQAVLIR